LRIFQAAFRSAQTPLRPLSDVGAGGNRTALCAEALGGASWRMTWRSNSSRRVTAPGTCSDRVLRAHHDRNPTLVEFVKAASKALLWSLNLNGASCFLNENVKKRSPCRHPAWRYLAVDPKLSLRALPPRQNHSPSTPGPDHGLITSTAVFRIKASSVKKTQKQLFWTPSSLNRARLKTSRAWELK
jgi:hypothetical protein